MATMAENVIVVGSKTRPPMLEKGMYDSWKTRILLYIQGKEDGEMLIDSIKNGPVKLLDEITIKDVEGLNEIVRKQTPTDLSPQEKLQKKYGIAPKNVWKAHRRPSKNSPLLQSYAPTVVQQPLTFQLDTGLVIPTFLLTDNPIASLNKAMIFLSSVMFQGRQSKGYTGNAGNNQALGALVSNTVGNAGANQTRVVTCYNYNGEGHKAKQCTARKRVKDFEWFKEKMLLAQAQEARVVLNDDQQYFLANSLEETNDCEDLQLQATINFKADHVDAYDSDYDDEATANTIFMENLSHVGSLNDDTVVPRYDSDTLSEVPQYDTYHDSDMLNSNIQELGYIENIVSNNESYDELKGNNDVISYTDYMLTIGNNEDNYVPHPV
ncbi:hypothetical protein Tco_0946782 [Tanacetum coccineum]